MPAAGGGTPTCPKCNSTDVGMTLKTASGAYYRCGDCGHMWHTDKPQQRARA